jgi:hypothetical protein
MSCARSLSKRQSAMLATATVRSTRSAFLVTWCFPKPTTPFSSLHKRYTHTPAKVYGDEPARGHRVRPIGHEDFGLVRPIVTPTFAADHRDVSEVAQAHSCGVDPTGSAALAVDGWDADLGRPPAREMGDMGVERFAIGELPGPREGKDVPVA